MLPEDSSTNSPGQQMLSPKAEVDRLIHICRNRIPGWHQPCPKPGHRNRYRALLIGINYKNKYNKKYRPLNACVKDVGEVKRLLIDTMGWCDDEITVMTDDEPLESALHPTKKNMIKEMRKLVKNARPGDNFVLYYAGHSDQKPAPPDSDESDGLDEHLVSSELKIILDNKLKTILAKPLPAGSRLTAIFDACHSGSLLDLKDKHPLRHQSLYSPPVAPSAEANRDASPAQSPPGPQKPRRASSLPALPALPALAIVPFRKAAVSTSKYAVGKGKQYWPVVRALVLFTILRRRSEKTEGQTDHPRNSALSHGADFQPQLSPVAEEAPSSFSQQHSSRPGPSRRFSVLSNDYSSSPTSFPSSDLPSVRTKHSSASARVPTPCSDCRPRLSPTPEETGPTVISLSACLDDQQAWERKKGAIMTEILCNLLRANPSATVGDISRELSHQLFKADLNRLAAEKKGKKDGNKKHPPQSEERQQHQHGPWQRHQFSYQFPRNGSLRNLDSSAEKVAHLPLFVRRDSARHP